MRLLANDGFAILVVLSVTRGVDGGLNPRINGGTRLLATIRTAAVHHAQCSTSFLLRCRPGV